MASPKVHVVITVPFVLFQFFSPDSFLVKGLKIVLILFAGVGIDIDHLTRGGVKRFLAGKVLMTGSQESAKKATAGELLDSDIFSGWVNYFHTWKGLILFGGLAWLFRSPGMAFAYAVHMFLDGGNCWNQIMSSSPLAKFIHEKILSPLGWIYTNPKIWLERSFEDWKKESEDLKRKSFEESGEPYRR